MRCLSANTVINGCFVLSSYVYQRLVLGLSSGWSVLIMLTGHLHPDFTGLGYRIPRGGMYELISCPNYLGETIEWIGYAVTTGSIVGTAFAFYTFANLAPRAHQHHQWYQETFPDYPVNRKAYIPCIW